MNFTNILDGLVQMSISFRWRQGMKRLTLNIGWLLACGLLAAGCGSGSASSTPSTTIQLSTTAATVSIGGTFTFVAVVTTTNTNQAVNWQVNSVPGGNTTVGTIDTSGNYTAPSKVPVPNTVTVTAIAQADLSVTASATVTIDSGIRVSVKPGVVTIGTGEAITFTATVTGAPPPNPPNSPVVTWIVCQAGAISTVTAATAPCPVDTTGSLGNVSTVGIYTAPPIIPTSNPVTIEAVSIKDPNEFGVATINLQAALDPTLVSVYPTQTAQGSQFVDVVMQGANMITTTDVFVNSTSLTNLTGATITAFGNVIRARVPSSFFATAPAVLQIQIARKGQPGHQEVPVGCTPNPALCSISVTPVRPAIVSSQPPSAFERPVSSGTLPFTIDGGYFGSNLISEFDGIVGSSTITPRAVTVSLPGGDLVTPGLHQISVTNPGVTTPAVLPQQSASVNFAVQPCIGAQVLCTPESGQPIVTTASLPLGGTSPVSIAVNTATGVAVVANKGSNDLTLVDLTVSPPALIGARIPVGIGPTGVAVDNVRNVAVVANNTDKTISVVNLATRAMTTVSTQIPAAPFLVAVNPITSIALVAYQNTSIGALIDLTQPTPTFIGVVTLVTGSNPHVAVMPSLNWGLVTGGGLGVFSIVDLQRSNSNLIGTGGAVRVSSSSTVTITTTVPHTLISGDAILMQGIVDTSFNGIFIVASVPSANSFTFIQAGADATSGGGKVFYSRPLATVSLSQNVTGVAVNPETKQAVITDPTNQSSVSTMSVLDQTVTPILLQSGTTGVAVNPYTDMAVAINPATLQAEILDLRLPQSLTSVNLNPNSNPSAIAIDPATNKAFIVNQATNDMTVISLGTSIKPLQLESVVLPVNRQQGTDLTLTSATTPLPLTLIGNGFVSQGPVVARVDGFALTPVGTVTDRQMSVQVPASLLTSPRRFAVDVVNSTPGSIPSNVEGFSVIQAVDLTSAGCPSPSPSAVAIDDVLNFAIVTESNCNSVALVNLSTGTVTKTLAVGANPQGVATYPSNGTAVVSNRGDNTATILDIADPTQTPVVVSTGVEPLGVAIDQTTGLAIVTNSNTNSNSISSFTATLSAAANSATSSATGGTSPVAVAIDTVNQRAVVANASSSTVSILDTSQNPPSPIAALSGPNQPTGVAFDPINQVFIVTASLGNAIFFVNAQAQQLSPARVGINPTAIAYNYLTSTIVTVNSISSTISVLDITDARVHANMGLKASQLGSIAIHPRTNIAAIVDSANNRLLLIPMPN
jgi:DNA-binding beta-propeller fold protein YncE